MEDETELRSVICSNRNAHVVITSRFIKWNIPKITIGNFSIKDVEAYAKKRLKNDRKISKPEF